MKAKFPVSSFQFQRSSNASSGIALIGIIAAIVIMGILGGGVLMLITTSSMESLQSLNWNKAFFAAESGISAAKYYMTANAGWYTNRLYCQTGLVGQASFSNNISTNAQSNVFVVSTGVLDDSRWTTRWSPSASETVRALIVYKQTTAAFPRYRTCTNLRRLSDELAANAVSAAIRWQRIVANPNASEFLLVTENNNGWIYAQTYRSGTWISNTLLNVTGRLTSAATRGFDVAYESLSNRGMVVYGVGYSSNPMYRIWTSNSWSTSQFININTSSTNPISWVRLISRPGTNEIMCLARWRRTASSNDSSAIIWNGTDWVNRTNLETNCGSQIALETFDAAYSANTALVVYINGSSPPQRRSPKYRTYTSSNGTWSAQNTMTALGTTEPRWIRVEYSPNSALAYAAFLTSGSRLWGTYWTNGGWSAYNTFSNLAIEISTRRAFDIAWSSQTNTLMVVYSRQNLNYQSYMLDTRGVITNNGNLVSTDDGQWCVLKADPFTSEFYYLALDDQYDVNFQRWAGTNWTLFPELETTTTDYNYMFIDFAFRLDSAPTNCWPLK